MKKSVLILAILSLVFCMTACGTKEVEEPKSAGMPNPLTEMSAQELLEKTGFTFDVPEGAEEIRYFTITGDPLTAQMMFNLDGKKVTCRCLPDGLPENGEVKDISGMYYQWKFEETGKVLYNDAVFKFNAGKEGWVGWYDYVPGILYSVSTDSGASVEELTRLAESCCPPVQGDVG